MKSILVLLTGAALLAAAPARAQKKVDFEKEVWPILQQNCVKCHGAEKQKGKLRLDSKEAAFKPGKEAATITIGEADKSELYRRVILPKGHDDVMPNEGELLTKAQTDLLRDWINQGADWPAGIAKAADAPKSDANDPVLPADFKPGPNEAKATAKLAQAGVDVRPVAMNSPWREANFRLQGTNVTDATLAPLKDLPSLIQLNLATTRVTDAGLENVKPLTNLTHLNLSSTAVTDKGLNHLKGLQNLVYLNLYGTAVSDAGLAQLKGLKRLKALYLWQTKTTTNGVAALQKALPRVQISTGAELLQIAKTEEKKEDKKDEKKADAPKPEEKKPAAPKPKKDEAKKEEKKAQ